MTSKQQKSLIFMAWLLYVSAYLGRYSYNSNILPMSIFYGVSDTEMGLATSFFFFAYGAGQIINGLLCKFYNVKYVLSGALIISSIINAVVFLGVLPFFYIKFLWLINGIAQSVLWSSLLMVLSRNLDENHIKKAVIAMSTTAGVGTLLSYCLSAALALFGGFRFAFLTGAVLMTASALVWVFIYDRITNKNAVKVLAGTAETANVEKKKSDKSVIKILILFGIFAIIINFIKDGLTTWVPKILFDTYTLSESLSIILTLVLPVLAVFGTALVVKLNKKVKEYTALISVLFITATILVCAIIGFLNTPLWIVVLIAFGCLALLMSGANNVVTSILPLSLRDKANSGFLGGILNGCCYVGSTISSVGLGAISDYYGEWSPVFYLLFILTAIVVVLSVIVALYKYFKNKKNSNVTEN